MFGTGLPRHDGARLDRRRLTGVDVLAVVPRLWVMMVAVFVVRAMRAPPMAVMLVLGVGPATVDAMPLLPVVQVCPPMLVIDISKYILYCCASQWSVWQGVLYLL
jgi:hypothetical protein